MATERTSHIVWEGNLARGDGRITADTGAFTDLGYSLPTRIGQPEGKTSPEELLAAAYGGCTVMSIAGQLTNAGTPPERLEASATITLDEVDGKNSIARARLRVRGTVPGLDEDAWRKAVEAGEAGCPFGRLLRAGGAQIDVEAELT
jgi:osmotically inducible protein OsmC